MSRVRILGPREHLEAVLAVVQDLGILHLAGPPEAPPMAHPEFTAQEARLRRRLLRLTASAEATLKLLDAGSGPGGTRPEPPGALPELARRTRRAARHAARTTAFRRD